MDKLKPTDIVVVQQNGTDWVDPSSGGPSTQGAKVWPARHWWVIPQGRPFSDSLNVRNDHGTHWVWEPAIGMELAQFIQLLAELNKEFVRA